ncbi:single-stranded DNA-binding protein [candidate division WOR-3 bacterium]|nr:single-stranded DNA-binding protein [candidate division WOR-3 bacterium]TET79327.1 MAG: single-stranded DNA-binding protein [Candidatus Cloacimonadota bacterium]
MSEIRLPAINLVLISGRLTADPNLNFTPDGVPVLKFRIASGRVYKDKNGNWKEAVTYIPVSVWREQAERLAEALHKGSAVYVEGRLQSRSWEVEGQKRNIVEINAWRIQNLEKITAEPKETVEEQEEVPETEKELQDDDLPF